MAPYITSTPKTYIVPHPLLSCEALSSRSRNRHIEKGATFDYSGSGCYRGGQFKNFQVLPRRCRASDGADPVVISGGIGIQACMGLPIRSDGPRPHAPHPTWSASPTVARELLRRCTYLHQIGPHSDMNYYRQENLVVSSCRGLAQFHP